MEENFNNNDPILNELFKKNKERIEKQSSEIAQEQYKNFIYNGSTGSYSKEIEELCDKELGIDQYYDYENDNEEKSIHNSTKKTLTYKTKKISDRIKSGDLRVKKSVAIKVASWLKDNKNIVKLLAFGSLVALSVGAAYHTIDMSTSRENIDKIIDTRCVNPSAEKEIIDNFDKLVEDGKLNEAQNYAETMILEKTKEDFINAYKDNLYSNEILLEDGLNPDDVMAKKKLSSDDVVLNISGGTSSIDGTYYKTQRFEIGDEYFDINRNDAQLGIIVSDLLYLQNNDNIEDSKLQDKFYDAMKRTYSSNLRITNMNGRKFVSSIPAKNISRSHSKSNETQYEDYSSYTANASIENSTPSFDDEER